jgi:hypothetical protein
MSTTALRPLPIGLSLLPERVYPVDPAAGPD